MDMRALWKGQPAPVADLDAMRRRIRRFALRRIGEACAVIVLMMAAIAAGVLIWTCWPPRLMCWRARASCCLSGPMEGRCASIMG